MSPPSATNDSWYFPFRDDDRDYQSPRSRALYCWTVFLSLSLSLRETYIRGLSENPRRFLLEILYFYAAAQFRPNKIETFIHGNRNITRIFIYVDNRIYVYYRIESSIFLNACLLYFENLF